jgi:hypothetical protein
LPARSPTVPAVTFKKLFAGQWLEVQVSQSFNDGTCDMKWNKGVAITAPLEGLWDLQGCLTAEDVKHMKSRVMQFIALEPVVGELRHVPLCAATFCKWLVEDATAFSARHGPQRLPQRAAEAEDIWQETDPDDI